MNDQPLDSSDVITWQATADYWKQELAALGVSQFDIEADAKFDPANLPAGKRAFLLALQSSSSPEAMEHLRNAVAADPYHYSARRMLLTLALSLAQFEEVLQNAQMAQQLYPEDVDFVLIESLALAAQARLNDAAERIRQTPLTPQQQQNWIDFGQFIKRLCHDVHPRQGIYRTDLSTISKLLAEFELKFQPLVLKRRWRFPPKVAEPFAELPNVLETSNSFPANRALASQLASIHPEGTLLLIAAESSIANKETPEQLETARDFFQQAVDAPSFIQNSEQIAWLGVYTMSMSLSILHKHDVEQNSERYVEACRHLDANKINNAGYLRTISITLGQQNQWDVARPFLDQWISLNPEGSQKFDAYWSKAVALKSAQEWVELLEFCNGLLSQYPELSSRDSSPNGYDWIGLRDFAIGQLKSRIGQSPFQKPPEEQRPPEINLDGGPPASG